MGALFDCCLFLWSFAVKVSLVNHYSVAVVVAISNNMLCLSCC
jgi:hypothetical protein